jgi:all-trans-8'-apo-beta-carotenal 15,15'-oxygenase
VKPRGVTCLRTLRRAHGFEPLAAGYGIVPPELNGRLLRIGPGKFEQNGTAYPHWFDGEGLITAIDFTGGRARAACRMIEPAGGGDPSYQRLGRFGLAPQGLVRRLRSTFDAATYVNAANTALMQWQGRLFALYEGDVPTEIDPETLATIGATDLGVISRSFGAHPKPHRPSGALINQGFRSPLAPHLDYVALGPDGPARRLGSTRYCGSLLTHDFAVTDTFIVSICSPLFADLAAMLLYGRSLSDSLVWRPERGTEILITPIDGSSPTRRIFADAMLFSHTANAFEEDGDIVIHGVVAANGSNVGWLGSVRFGAETLAPATPGRLTELRITGSGAVGLSPLGEASVDFPVIDSRAAGRRQAVVYTAGFRNEQAAYRDLFDVLVKFDLAGGTTTKVDFGDGHFVSEPLFAPRPGGHAEDDGWLLCLNYDAGRDESYVAILTAAGTPDLVATLPLGQPLPISFHGLWTQRD